MKRSIEFLLSTLLVGFAVTPFFSLSTTAQDSPDVAEGQGEINERRVHIDQLVERLKSLSETDGDRESLRSELAQALMEEFTEMESTRRRQVEEMERRIEQLKNTLSLRSQNAEQIVAARISYLLGEASILDWAYRMPDNMLLNSEDGAEAEAEEEEELGESHEEDMQEHSLSEFDDGIAEEADEGMGDDEGDDEGSDDHQDEETDVTRTQDKMNPDLLLGYGLAKSTILDLQKEAAQIEERKARAEEEFSRAKEKLMREKWRNNSQRASEHDELLRSMEERLRKLDELNAQLQNRKTEITMKEMRLLPLEREVERVHPSRGNRVGIEGAEEKK
jgi:hypothetical protein